MEFEKILELYDYEFPEKLIAKKPASPRDGAKLLVYDRETDRDFFDVFRNIDKYLPKKAVLVFNETKVVPARLWPKKSTGGKIQLLYVGKEGELLKFIVDRRLNVGEKVFLSGKIFLIAERQSEGIYFFRPSFPAEDILKILDRFGETPIPPYIKNSPLKESELKEKYQTVFAKIKGSVAAPTASLHFTKRLMQKLKSKGFNLVFIVLHVNLGTFAKLTPGQIASSKLHEEYYEINRKTAELLNKAKSNGRPIVAVGTTVVRALESASDAKGRLAKLSGKTDLFIKEGYKFKFIDSIITNFHVPKSSLMMLVSSFTGRTKLLSLYRKAIKAGFRLFSFGDGMLIR